MAVIRAEPERKPPVVETPTDDSVNEDLDVKIIPVFKVRKDSKSGAGGVPH